MGIMKQSTTSSSSAGIDSEESKAIDDVVVSDGIKYKLLLWSINA